MKKYEKVLIGIGGFLVFLVMLFSKRYWGELIVERINSLVFCFIGLLVMVSPVFYKDRQKKNTLKAFFVGLFILFGGVLLFYL